MRRSDQRRDAVFALYQHDVTGGRSTSCSPAREAVHPRARRGRDASRAALDAEIARRSAGWALDRIAPLERTIMRVALYEMRHRDDIPAEVAIDEAVNLAKEYCGADAPGFVNGILGAAARELAEARREVGMSDDPTAEARAIGRAARASSPSAAARPEARRRARRRACARGGRARRRGGQRDRARAARGGVPRGLARRWPDYPDDLRRLVEDYLDGCASPSAEATAGLDEAMRYSLLAGGKRIRPVLCLATARAVGRRPGRGAARRPPRSS